MGRRRKRNEGEHSKSSGCRASRSEEGINQCEGRRGGSVVCMRAQHDCGEMNGI